MATILHSIQIGSALLLIVLILLQRPSTGDTGNFGDSGSFMQTRRGSERFFFIFTVIVALILLAACLGVIVA